MFRAMTSQIWTNRGTVISGSGTDNQNNLCEPSVVHEGNAQILSGTVFKMWLRRDWATPVIDYYESLDGITSWTPYASNPVLSGVWQPFVFSYGGTLYMYAHAAAAGSPWQRHSSSNGIAWTQDSANVMAVGGAGAWDDYDFGNNFVWAESSTDWRMLYEAHRSGGVWKLGYATSSDAGLTWSKSGSNPVIAETGSVGGPWLYKDATGNYWVWLHHSASGFVPTDIERYTSSNLTSWTKNPVTNTLARAYSDEGNGGTIGQIADFTAVEVGTQTYAWFAASPNGTANTGHFHIKLAIARLPLSQLINTNEGY